MASSKLAGQYRGATAAHYDEDRVAQAKWAREQALVPSLLEVLPHNATLLDIPVGTGRFFEFYHRHGLRVTGVDISKEMLAQSQAKADQLGLSVILEEGDIRRLRYAANAFEGAACIRLFNLLDLPSVVQGIAELARVSRRHIVLGVRSFIPAAELMRRPGGSGLRLRQVVRKLKAMMSTRAITIHPRAPILEAFAENGLTIVRAECVEESVSSGSELIVYLLEKTHARR